MQAPWLVDSPTPYANTDTDARNSHEWTKRAATQIRGQLVSLIPRNRKSEHPCNVTLCERKWLIREIPG